MRKALILTLAGAASIMAFAPPAVARDGCGDGWHRNRYGECVPNYNNRRFYRSRDAYYYDRDFYPEVGRFYRGRGYWSGDRYFMNRRWDGRGWRYW
jgi:hypothetical protein